MGLLEWLGARGTRSSGRPGAGARREAPRVLLELEQLEERCVPAGLDPTQALPPAPGVGDYFGLREAGIASIPRGTGGVLFLGDSILDYFASGLGADIWNAQFAPVANDLAIAGNTTQQIQWQVLNGDLDGLNPQAVVLMVGINDLRQGETPDQVADGIAASVADIQAAQPGAHILLLGLLPAGQSPDDPIRAEIAQTNSLIAQLDDGNQVRYADIGANFLQPDQTIAPDIMPDFVHPNQAGYAILASALVPLLESPPALPLMTGVSSASAAFTPSGEVVEVVGQDGKLTQLDSAGAHVLMGGVSSANVAYGPFGLVAEVVGRGGTLTQLDATGAHFLFGGVSSAGVSFGPSGEVAQVVGRDGTLTQFDATGIHVLMTGVSQASMTFGPFGLVTEVVGPNGKLTQIDAAGAHPLFTGTAGASAGFIPSGEVLVATGLDGTLTQFDSSGAHPLGTRVSAATVTTGPDGEVVVATDQDGTLSQIDPAGALLGSL